MAISQYYVDYGAGNDTTGNGTVGTPWKTIQKALDTITRNATDGDQINVKAGTAQVLAASLALATYGTPAGGAPLILRGYTSAANDGGRGHILYPGGQIINSTTLGYIHWIDLDLEGGGNPGRMIVLNDCNLFYRCKFIPNKGIAAVAYCMTLGDENRVIECAFLRSNGYGFAVSTTVNNYNIFLGCFSDSTTGLVSGHAGNVAIGNTVIIREETFFGIGLDGSSRNIAIGNIVYNIAAGTTRGISLGNAATRENGIALNNIVCGQSGVGGVGIGTIGGDIWMAGYNAYWNNTTNYSASDTTIVDLTANDVALAADPFTDAANGDFSLTTVAQAALRSAGWPASYLGAHANTDPHITIGALQYGPTPTGGGRPAFGDRTGGKW